MTRQEMEMSYRKTINMNKLFNLTDVRQETPGCAHVIHFNSAGAGLMPQTVLDAQVNHLKLEAEIGGYEAAWREEARIERAYDAVTELLNGRSRDEIAVVENATVAWDMAFHSIDFQEGDRILTAKASYVSNYIAFLLVAERHGVQIDVIPNDELGQVSADALDEMMDDRVKLIAITHIPTNNGLVNPAEAVGAIARKWDCLYLLDACQSAGQVPLDVQAIGCDMLSATGRKWLRGPRGVGFLYVKQERIAELKPPFLDLHSAKWTATNRYEIRPDARRFENWESNYGAKVGLAVAVDYALGYGMESLWAEIQVRADHYRTELSRIPAVTVRDIGEVQGGIVTFTVDGVAPAAVQAHLAQNKVNVTTSDVTSTRLDMEDRGLTAVVRSSVHYYNSHEEIAKVCSLVSDIA